MHMKTMVNHFLAQQRVAIIGVSRSMNKTADAIYEKFKNNGYEVVPITLHAKEYKGVRSFASIKDVPGGVQAAVLILNPETTEMVVRECVEAGVKCVWVHFVFGYKLPDEVVTYCEDNKVDLIPGACPMMYLKPDLGHLCFRFIGQFAGFVPQ